MTTIGVVAVVYGQSDEHLHQFIEQLDQLDGAPLPLWLICNEKDRDLSGFEHAATIVRMPDNVGWTGGANIGAKAAGAAGCEYALLINTDVAILSPELVGYLLQPFASDDRCGFVSPGIVLDDRRDRVWYRGATISRWHWVPHHPGITRPYRPTWAPRPVQVINGCCVLVKVAAFQEVGGFDQELFSYFDDPDLSLRASRANWRCYLYDAPLVAHRHRGRELTPVSAFYFGRNPFILARKHTPALGRPLVVVAQFAAAIPYLLRADSAEARRLYLRGLRRGLVHLFSGDGVGMGHSTS